MERCRFLADKGPLRDAKLKLIPSLAEGSWMIRQAVGQTPVMLGKRLKTQYFMENAYVEADVDISANATAAGITSMVAGSIKNLVFDIGILLEVRTSALPCSHHVKQHALSVTAVSLLLSLQQTQPIFTHTA